MNNEEIIEELEGSDLTEEIAETEEPVTTEDKAEGQGEYSDNEYYSSLAEEDIKALRNSFSELKDLKDLTELDNPVRFAKLRDLGYSAVEAYLESTKRKRFADNRSHLHASIPMSRSKPGTSLSREELLVARELFPDASDAEIQKLYRSVTR